MNGQFFSFGLNGTNQSPAFSGSGGSVNSRSHHRPSLFAFSPMPNQHHQSSRSPIVYPQAPNIRLKDEFAKKDNRTMKINGKA